MNKQSIFFGLSVVTFLLSLPVDAQQPGKVHRLAILLPGSPSASAGGLQIFQNRLQELGYADGKNIITEHRYANGKLDALPKLADELNRLKVDVIVTSSSPAIRALKDATKTIPIVFVTATDPVGDGLVSSLAQPGGNVTGLTLLAPELNGKRLELLKEAFPKLVRVGFLSREASNRFNDAQATAKALGLRLAPMSLRDAETFAHAFDSAKKAGIQAITASPSPFLNTHKKRIIDLANKNKFPAIYTASDWVQEGGLMSYGPDIRENWRGAAMYVDKILKGRTPADLPVEQPMKFEFFVNLNTAKQSGLTIPPNVLVRADRVIR